MKISRFPTNPIIIPEMDVSIGSNINGPSLIRVPDWLSNPLAKYYLYFAHHQGQFIRLAYADHLAGPWTIYTPGTLKLEQTPCFGHIASPDVHLDHKKQRLIMYYHGPTLKPEELADDWMTQKYPFLGGQRSLVATSGDGLNFTSGDEVFGPSYFRVFNWQGYVYAIGMPGIFFRSKDGLTNFEAGPVLFDSQMRHCALKLTGSTLNIFYSNRGDCPEHILLSQIDISGDWMQWQASEPVSVILPETDYEGGDLPLEPSEGGAIHQRVRQLRDPGIYQEDGRTYLLYSIAGEHGLAIAELID